jgi:hypothetical protein
VDLNIRDFDEELLRELKAKAASEGLTLKDWVTERLKESVNGDSGSECVPVRSVRSRVATGGQVGESSPVSEQEVQKPEVERRRGVSECDPPGSIRHEGKGKDDVRSPSVKRLTPEEFNKLSPSKQLRAMREGRH